MSVFDGKNLFSGVVSGVEAMTIMNSRGRAQNSNLTRYEAPSLQSTGSGAVENENLSLVRSKGRIIKTILEIFANSLNGDTTFTVRRHKQNNTVHQDAEFNRVISAGQVTVIEDNTKIEFEDWDLFNMRIITAGTVGSITYKFLFVWEWDKV